MARKVIILEIVLSLKKVLFSTLSSQLCVCSHALVANMIPNWIADTVVIKHIVRDRADFVEFHRYLVGKQSIVLRNASEEDVLGVGTYQLLL